MKRALCVAICVVVCVLASAQEPDRGTVAGNVYTNNFFRFSYSFPATWSVHTDELAAQLANSSSKVLLYVKSESGVGAVAVTYQDLSGTSIGSSSDYLDALQAATQHARAIGQRHFLGPPMSGVRQDFEVTPANHYLSYVAGLVQGYGLKFAIDAGSQPELETLVKTVADVRFAPDWSSGVPAGEGCPGASTDAQGRRVPQRIRVSSGVQEGLLLKKIAPKYPKAARDNHIQGTVVMSVVIGCDGAVRQISVVSGPRALIQSALDAVQHWQYKPYMLNGKPIEVETMIVVNYELH